MIRVTQIWTETRKVITCTVREKSQDVTAAIAFGVDAVETNNDRTLIVDTGSVKLNMGDTFKAAD